MSPASTDVPRSAHCDHVDEMLDRGDSFVRVEELVSKTELPNDERDALWLYAWTRSNLRDREARRRRTSKVASGAGARRDTERPKSLT
jgi:hypothetical protein